MHPDQAFVSVILPTFNRANTLSRSIRSVLGQDHSNLELIVVDDGSTDRTQELVADIRDPRIRYVRFDQNRGQSAARNAGISISSAGLIAFQDSDDLWRREKLARQLAILLDDPELAGVYCDLKRHLLDGAQFLMEAPELKLGAIFDHRPTLFQTYGLGIQTCIFRKSVLHDSGLFHERLHCFEDLELLLRIAHKHRLCRLPEPLVDYYESEQSVSKSAVAERKAWAFLLKRYGYRRLQRAIDRSISPKVADQRLCNEKRIKPHKIRIEASSFCQLRCPSCPTTSGHIHPAVGNGFLKFEHFRELLDLNASLEQVEISNYGEVFLNPELLPILEYAHQKNVAISIENGTNLNFVRDEVIEGLVKFQVRVLTCSIDGATSESYRKYRVRGNFDKVIYNIEKINSYKRRYQSAIPKLIWQFVVFGHNEHEISVARKMAAKLGMEFTTKLTWDTKFSPIRDADLVRSQTGWQSITREEYEQEHEEKFGSGICHQLWDAPQINWDGKVIGCCRNFWGDFGGNAFTDGLVESINSEKMNYAREMLTGQSPARGDIPCSTCEIYIAMRNGSKFIARDPFSVLPVHTPLAPQSNRVTSEARQTECPRSGREIAGQNFQTFWWGKALSPYEVLCLKSFLDRGHTVTLYTYDTDIHVPRGVAVRDAGEIFNRDQFFFNQEGYGRGLPNAFSNMFRYKLLAERGGWWIDADVVCLSRTVPHVGEFLARHDSFEINNAIMFFQQNHPLMTRCLERSVAIGRAAKFAETGPLLITAMAEELYVSAHTAPVCYPVHFSEAIDMLLPTRREDLSLRISKSLFLHLYNSALRTNGVNQYFLPPAGSLLRHFVELHGVDGWTGEYDEHSVPKNNPMFAETRHRVEAERRIKDEPMALQIREDEIAVLKHELAAQKHRVDEMIASRSWRVTEPLRKIRRWELIHWSRS